MLVLLVREPGGLAWLRTEVARTDAVCDITAWLGGGSPSKGACPKTDAAKNPVDGGACEGEDGPSKAVLLLFRSGSS